MRTFDLVLRVSYTRWSCRPFGASLRLERRVQAEDETDAVRQACLCVDRDLEELLGEVNTINVSEVVVVLDSVRPASRDDDRELWNQEPFDRALPIPRHVRLGS